jgi:protein-tyrosine phosphatase
MNATVITNDLAVGAYTAIEEMHKNGWQCICLARTVPVPTYCKHIPLHDGGNPPEPIQKAIQWILDQWKEGKKTFVCCRHGMNRSVLTSAAALNLVRGGWFMDSWKIIGTKRTIANGRDDTLRDVLAVLMEMKK